jgi:cyclophilin family peptidyl-prolyl cis-trans isomerase/HEAT repeat protein
MPYRFLFPVLLLLWLPACIPPAEEPVTELDPRIDLSDSLSRQLLEWQSSRREDSLRSYLNDSRPRYRYLAVRAFGSFHTMQQRTVDSLAARLRDPVPVVRELAAYALGQTGRPDLGPVLAAAFDPESRHPAANAAILAAVGRTGADTLIQFLADVGSYRPRDTLLREGQLWGLYHAGLRGLVPQTVAKPVLGALADPQSPGRLRHQAAHYLHRIALPDDSLHENRLIDLLRSERDPLVKMGLLRALGRRPTSAAHVAVLRQLEASGDWRVRVEAVYGLSAAPYASVRESILEALRDPHPLVREAAAAFVLTRGVEEDAPFYFQLATATADTLTGIRLLGAANRHLSAYLPDYRDRINGRLRLLYRQSPDPFLRAAAVTALGEFPWNYRQLYHLLASETEPVVRTAVAEQLYQISRREDFAAWFRASTGRVGRELAGNFRQLIEAREEGPAYFAARALLANPERYVAYYPDPEWIYRTRSTYELPRQLETYREVARAAAALRGGPEPDFAETLTLNRPDWDVLEGGEPIVDLLTDAGSIRLKLWPRVAPATVSNFLRLVGSGYYDGKLFHRVVPNFVAQGGGPRGDGYGSENFLLPTETPPLHWDRAGLLGMASAGRDTEGVQFFITHRPTPHLDGNYTLFGEVIEGQQVVDRLVPGSIIRSIRRIDE